MIALTDPTRTSRANRRKGSSDSLPNRFVPGSGIRYEVRELRFRSWISGHCLLPDDLGQASGSVLVLSADVAPQTTPNDGGEQAAGILAGDSQRMGRGGNDRQRARFARLHQSASGGTREQPPESIASPQINFLHMTKAS